MEIVNITHPPIYSH